MIALRSSGTVERITSKSTCSSYPAASSPWTRKSNTEPRFSGVGAVTKMLEYPDATACAIASPSATDLPRPLAAVSETVVRSVFSEMDSISVSSARAWSMVRASGTMLPTTGVSASDSLRSVSSAGSRGAPRASAPRARRASRRVAARVRDDDEIGSTESSSSTTIALAQSAIESVKRSLNRGTTSPCASERNRAWTSIASEYSLVSDSIVLSRMHTIPPPSTVSIVRARMLGVTASKSCSTAIPYVRPSTRCVSVL
jgi:hypothetical protein